MDALGTLGIALAGGSIGSVLTLLAGVPEQVKHNNRRAEHLDADLRQYVSDECVRLEREVRGLKNRLASQGQLYSGAIQRAEAHAKEEVLHRYRDQLTRAEREWQALRDSEGLRHRAWRRLGRGGSLPALTADEAAQPILDGWWRAPVPAADRAEPYPVSDPTRRPLEWALDKYGHGGGG